jgi:hypothetical protein
MLQEGQRQCRDQLGSYCHVRQESWSGSGVASRGNLGELNGLCGSDGEVRHEEKKIEGDFNVLGRGSYVSLPERRTVERMSCRWVRQ